MRSYKKIMPLFLIVALFGSAAFSLKNRSDTYNDYLSALNEARKYASEGIEADAITSYKKAISLYPTKEAYLEAGQVFLDNGDYSGAKRWYKEHLKADLPNDPDTYAYGIKMYLEKNNYRSAFDVYDEYKNRGLSSDSVEAAISEIKYKYDLVGKFADVGLFSELTGTAPVKEVDGKWGYITSGMSRELPYIYNSAFTFGTYAAVKDMDNNPYYIDRDGNIKINERVMLDADPELGKVCEFKKVQSSLLLVYNGSIWNYYDSSDYSKRFGGYAFATPINNGAGAVSQDGKKWALISAKGDLLTDYVFSDVVRDENDLVCRTGIVTAKDESGYIFLDNTGAQIGTASYDKADMFFDDSYAAVQKNGQWFYINPDGETVLTVSAEEARSFSKGLAAVKRDGKWGYINTLGEQAIPCVFEDVRYFNYNGTAFVKNEQNEWNLLELYEFNHG